MPRIDLTGKTFNLLTVIEFSHTTKAGASVWKCECSCKKEDKNIKYVQSNNLKSNSVKSCGCLIKLGLNATHGHSRHGTLTLEYSTYREMLKRCYNKNHKHYNNYGGRGITVCDRWRFGENGKSGFECFLEDMGPRPSRCYSIHRKKDKNYGPGVCIWGTRKVQSRDTQRTIWKTYKGETKALADWADD